MSERTKTSIGKEQSESVPSSPSTESHSGRSPSPFSAVQQFIPDLLMNALRPSEVERNPSLNIRDLVSMANEAIPKFNSAGEEEKELTKSKARRVIRSHIADVGYLLNSGEMRHENVEDAYPSETSSHASKRSRLKDDIGGEERQQQRARSVTPIQIDNPGGDGRKDFRNTKLEETAAYKELTQSEYNILKAARSTPNQEITSVQVDLTPRNFTQVAQGLGNKLDSTGFSDRYTYTPAINKGGFQGGAVATFTWHRPPKQTHAEPTQSSSVQVRVSNRSVTPIQIDNPGGQYGKRNFRNTKTGKTADDGFNPNENKILEAARSNPNVGITAERALISITTFPSHAQGLGNKLDSTGFSDRYTFSPTVRKRGSEGGTPATFTWHIPPKSAPE